jgi:hypothetical protein
MSRTKRKLVPKKNASHWGFQKTQEVTLVNETERKERVPEDGADPWEDTILYSRKNPGGKFTPMETGEPDQNPQPDSDNPQAMQGGSGPLGQEGEGNRQSDELAELEEIEPDIKLDRVRDE